MDLTARVLDTDGSLLLDLNAGPYRVKTMPDHARVWQGERNTSPWVDGDAPAGPETLAVVVKELEVRIRAASWSAVEDAYEALIDAVERPRWGLALGAQGAVRTYRVTQRASSRSPMPADAVVNRTRVVSLTVSCQPMATLTGV